MIGNTISCNSVSLTGWGESGVFGGFLEPGLGMQKLQIVLFGVEVTMPDSQ